MPKSITDQLKTQTLVLLEQGKVSLLHLTEDKQLELQHSIPWEAKTLSQAFEKLSEHLTETSVSIILGDNLAFLSPIVIDKSTKDIKQAILDKAEASISLPIEELGVDWLQVNETDDRYLYQIFAVQKSLLSLVGRATQQASLTVASVEPLAFLLGYLFHTDEPTFVAWEGTRTTLALVQAGKLLSAAVVKPENVYNSIETLLSFSEAQLSLTPKAFIMASASKHLTKSKLKDFDLEVFADGKNPLKDKKSKKAIFSETDEAGSDQSFAIGGTEATSKDFELDVEAGTEEPLPEEDNKLDQTDSEPELDISKKAPKLPLRVAELAHMDEPTPPRPNPAKPKAKVLVVALTVLTILIGIVVGGVLVYQNALNQTAETETAPEPTIDPAFIEETLPPGEELGDTASPSADVADFDPATIEIQVLNGSGTPGAAGAASDELEAAGFTEITAGNADSYDYATTQISVKSGQTALLQSLNEALSGEYTIGETDDDLAATSPYDAVVIVGQQ